MAGMTPDPRRVVEELRRKEFGAETPHVTVSCSLLDKAAAAIEALLKEHAELRAEITFTRRKYFELTQPEKSDE